jgi:mRNA-degrading endonuclease RelE of RelBE toxin-antitoxin system
MFRVFLTKRAAAALKKLAPEAQAACLAALRELPAVFGRPHVHAGLGVRQLRPGLYELRVGLVLRAIFLRSADALEVQMIGDHAQVRQYLRGRGP